VSSPLLRIRFRNGELSFGRLTRVAMLGDSDD
jgi:hypothetical protein